MEQADGSMPDQVEVTQPTLVTTESDIEKESKTTHLLEERGYLVNQIAHLASSGHPNLAKHARRAARREGLFGRIKY